MDTKFIPSEVEQKLYKFWEESGLFEAKVNKDKKPFSIILPPPNANGSLHLGHAMFVYEDLMIRYNKLLGNETLWLLGLDHAGFETQYVFEKHLRKQGKSRFDYDRETLFKMIWDFVMENKETIKKQMKRMGYALDWSKEKFTMDKDIVKIVNETFKKLYDEGLLYRAERLVNYCTRDGTSFSDLEVVDQEKEGSLYYIKYPLVEGGFITVATTRPETMFGDVAVMVNPADKRYENLIGKKISLPLTKRVIPIIADSHVDQKFATGAVKVTPAHDVDDYEVGKRHDLPFINAIGFNGKMQNTEVVDGLKIQAAREQTLKLLEEQKLIEKTVPHKMVVKTCYRCGNTLEPLLMEQWYVKTKPLTDKAKTLINEGKIKIYPKRFTKHLNFILDNFIDWNISRQIVWGIRIPAFRCSSKNEWFVDLEKPDKCQICGTQDFEQDSDTFDTWFSSAQWPFVTLMTEGKDFYNYFYPTSVMETGHDILRAWVARMIMVGYFATGKEPFKNIFLHGMVRDGKGQKMSKSKGNVIDPLIMVDKYGADALRLALLFGVKEGNDLSLSEEKIIGMRNFTNKVWNIGRFVQMHEVRSSEFGVRSQNKLIDELESEFEEEKKNYLKCMKNYQFSKALELVYEFVWHRFADYYIEQLKDDLKNGNIKALEMLKLTYQENLKMLHPFAPFVTEAVWKVFEGEEKSILQFKL